jgi:hypothetical protein
MLTCHYGLMLECDWIPIPPNAEVRDRRPSASDLSATANGGSLH